MESLGLISTTKCQAGLFGNSFNVMRLVTPVSLGVLCVTVEMLQTLVHSGLGGAVSQQGAVDPGNTASVLLPRRSETFGGFDSHQMNSSKCESMVPLCHLIGFDIH